MYSDASNANRIRFNTKGRQESYTHWKYLKDHGKKST